jgi:hypothetical protein
LDGSVSHLREFVNVQHGVERYMYAYHLPALRRHVRLPL